MNSLNRTFGFILAHPLAKRHPFRAFLNFAWWQLQSRFSPAGFIVKPFLNGIKFYARKGLTGITGNIYTGLHEFTDMAFVLHLLRPEDVFFDIGANVGSYTLLASGVCSAQSVALEPAPSTFDILSQNIRLNKLTNNVTLLNAAAGAVAETLKFSLGEDTTNHILAANETGKMSAEVPIITVDSLFSQNKPILLKIDVEGFETEVIKGMQATLKDSTLQAIIIELNGSGGRYGFNELDIHQTLLSNGFAPYHYNAFERELTKVDKWGSYNTIYIRNEQFISTRLKTAKPFNAMGEAI
jgi:FkbM family methyltransferase